jgi:hypothetical protein
MLTFAETTSKRIPIDLPPCSRRELDYYLECGRHYRERRESLSREEWKLYKKKEGHFLDKCLDIVDGWENLSERVRESLSSLQYPLYLTATAASALFKVPSEIIGECIDRLKSLIEESGSLTSNNIERIARLFHFKRKTYLIIGEVITDKDWELVSRKYRQLKDPGRLEGVKKEARRLAGDGTIFTEHVVEALLNLGYDPAAILPKPKKKYSDRDLEAATEPIERERDSLKSENEALRRLLERAGISLPNTPEDNDGGNGGKKDLATDSPETGLDGENPLPPPAADGDPTGAETNNSPTLGRVPRVDLGRTVPLADRGGSPVPGRKKTVDDLTIEDLKERAARTYIGRVLTIGKIIEHNGSSRVWKFRSKDARTFFLKAEAIEVEYPPGSGEYRSLAEIIAGIGNEVIPENSPLTGGERSRKRARAPGFGKT